MMMNKYNVSGYYKVNGTEEKHFDMIAEARDEFEATKIVLGNIAWRESLKGNSIMFDRFHYELEA